MASPSKRSEDVYGQKLDRCLYNGLIKFVTGVGVGIVFSALLFKRKPWPVILGGGIGTGMGISDCNNEFKSSGFRETPSDKTSETS
ncbi:MICOS complex subunit Mic10-like isoform X2 [Physella acuta]|uniref:MICOS complex subunit Mic10-like isoform X2 n=1 Tax=Physella acuta TaxID=109671 RepID=UPI0027DCC0B6|nr:MICOS complex subunit Mic10-like isoform X2 [Physella acuta]